MHPADTQKFAELMLSSNGPFGCKDCVEMNMVVPSKLTKHLLDTNHTIEYINGKDHGVWCSVMFGDYGLVARAFSSNNDEALCHAVYNEMIQENKIIHSSKFNESTDIRCVEFVKNQSHELRHKIDGDKILLRQLST